MIELKRCPFCGGAGILQEHLPHEHFLVDMPDHPGSATIECGRCEAGMIAETVEAVTTAWNRRAAPSPQGDARDREDAERYRILKQMLPQLLALAAQGGINTDDAPQIFASVTDVDKLDAVIDAARSTPASKTEGA